MSWSATTEYEAMLAELRERGMGAEMGFGRRPAIIVVDMQRGFVDPRFPLGADAEPQIAAVRELLAVARRRALPVIFATVRYDAGLADTGVWRHKIPANLQLVEGSEQVELDPRLERRPDELLIIKKHASPFFGTTLAAELTGRGVDTLLIAGFTTSGCVRACAVDASAHGFRPIVVREAVGDRRELPHLASLYDIQVKYGDVVSLERALAYLEAVEAPGAPATIAPLRSQGES
ncbi:isochorismatase family protein [Capillimicrobium parvum]|uniref:Maleamate amidohydrolase n=1 Tax=Capillimicrobium parvum TaxID=2884022 RepID=A0A9E7C2B8_9ACTN|nr:isochorismatase family protein [Capillimicrobium parvum]UGS37288.1 Maleamate amidohydrolase [Capillimicrobium parvum]